MTLVALILGSTGALLLVILKALAVDQVRGEIQRRITADLEATIASLPDDLQAQWADEWRAELAAVISMPLTAARMARGMRHSASELVGEPVLAPAVPLGQIPQRPSHARVQRFQPIYRSLATSTRAFERWLTKPERGDAIQFMAALTMSVVTIASVLRTGSVWVASGVTLLSVTTLIAMLWDLRNRP